MDKPKFHCMGAVVLVLVAAVPHLATAQGKSPSQRDESQNRQQQQPQGGNSRGSQQTPQASEGGHQGGAPAQGGSRSVSSDSHANYSFEQQDRERLHTHYQRILGNVNRDQRPQFQAGQTIPNAYRGAITPSPESLRRRLPPPPDGYEIGYYQGYTVVYDPMTFLIITVVDLLGR